MRDYDLYLEDILDSIVNILKYTKNSSYNQFLKDRKTVDAVVRNFEIIGEATRQLPKELKEKHQQIEWKSMIDFRNVVVHEYFAIDLEIMWDIIKTKLPELKLKIKKLLAKNLPQSKN